MYRMASFIAFLIVGFCVVGYFRGWLAVETSKPDLDGKVHVNFTVDKNKLKDDVEAAKRTVKSGVDKLKDEFGDEGKSSSAPATGFNSNYTPSQAPAGGYDNVRYR